MAFFQTNLKALCACLLDLYKGGTPTAPTPKLSLNPESIRPVVERARALRARKESEESDEDREGDLDAASETEVEVETWAEFGAPTCR